MADTKDFTTDHCQGTRTKCITLCAEYRSLDDIESRLQSTIRLKLYLASEVVGFQCIVCLYEPKFPGVTCKFDRTDRRCAGTAVCTGDDDLVGIRLGDTCRDRTHTCRGHQLDCDPRFGIDLLEVKDKLCQILDRIDIVMRRRRDQCHARHRIPESCDQWTDF